MVKHNLTEFLTAFGGAHGLTLSYHLPASKSGGVTPPPPERAARTGPVETNSITPLWHPPETPTYL